MKNTKLITLVVVLFTITAVCFFAGCGDDDVVTSAIPGPQGPAGPAGADGADGIAGNTGTLQVNVADIDGNPVSGFKISLIPVQIAGSAITGTADQTGDGFYIFDNLAAGTYEMCIEVLGYLPFCQNIIVGSGVNEPISITLDRIFYGIPGPWEGNNTPFYAISESGDTTFIGDTGFSSLLAMDIYDNTIYAIGEGDMYPYFPYGYYRDENIQESQVDNLNIITIDPTSGQGTLLVPIQPFEGELESISFDSKGNLFALIGIWNELMPGRLQESVSGDYNLYLAKISLETGAVTFVSSEPVKDLDLSSYNCALAFAPGDDPLYFAYNINDTGSSFLSTVSLAGVGGTDVSIPGLVNDYSEVESMDFQNSTGRLFGIIDTNDGNTSEHLVILGPSTDPLVPVTVTDIGELDVGIEEICCP